VLALVAAYETVVYAPTLTTGTNRAAAIAGILASVWALRRSAHAVARLEETRVHAWAANALIRVVPLAWWLAAAVQWTSFSAGMAALWAATIEPAFVQGGVGLLVLGATIRALRTGWDRPRDPLIVNAREVELAFSGTLLEVRAGRLVAALAFAALVWGFGQAL
jgi:hypothetical protein